MNFKIRHKATMNLEAKMGLLKIYLLIMQQGIISFLTKILYKME